MKLTGGELYSMTLLLLCGASIWGGMAWLAWLVFVRS
jgi:hypothetical protein